MANTIKENIPPHLQQLAKSLDRKITDLSEGKKPQEVLDADDLEELQMRGNLADYIDSLKRVRLSLSKQDLGE